jgi:hypothetical protein
MMATAWASGAQAGTAPKVNAAMNAGPIWRRIGAFERASSIGSSGSGRTRRRASSTSVASASQPMTLSMAASGSVPRRAPS